MKLSTKKRSKLSSNVFGIPEDRKYPMQDRKHAINAKARASQMVKNGKLSDTDKERIFRKADRIINR